MVFDAMKRAMPKTNKAELALDKFVNVLEQHLEQSLMHMDDNMYKFFKHFYVSTHNLSLEVGQFVIDGKRQYLPNAPLPRFRNYSRRKFKASIINVCVFLSL